MPREITHEVRRRVGLPVADERPYRWSFAVFVVAIACAPLLLAGYFRTAALVAIVGLGIVPWLRVWERRQALALDSLYRDGTEVVGRVMEIEPSGHLRRDHVVHIEFFASNVRVSARLHGSPLARRGLGPGDDVVIVYTPERPKRCLIVERIVRRSTS